MHRLLFHFFSFSGSLVIRTRLSNTGGHGLGGAPPYPMPSPGDGGAVTGELESPPLPHPRRLFSSPPDYLPNFLSLVSCLPQRTKRLPRLCSIRGASDKSQVPPIPLRCSHLYWTCRKILTLCSGIRIPGKVGTEGGFGGAADWYDHRIGFSSYFSDKFAILSFSFQD